MIKLNKLFIALVFVACSVGANAQTTTETGVVITGVKWATRNVGSTGTFVIKPEDYGGHYQWNRKDTANFFLYYDYYASPYPTATSWLAANNPCPAGWRVPTKEELSLLDTDNVTSEWTIENGINGRRFTDKTTNNSIFLPAAGYRSYNDGTLNDAGSFGYYWSSTESSSGAYYLYFNSGYAYLYFNNLTYGFSVRCVAE